MTVLFGSYRRVLSFRAISRFILYIRQNTVRIGVINSRTEKKKRKKRFSVLDCVNTKKKHLRQKDSKNLDR